MNIRTLAFISLLASSNLAFAQDAATDSGFAWGGNLYLALQNWTDVTNVSPNDTSSGVGFALNIGIGYKIDKDFTLLVGPQVAVNHWDSNNVSGFFIETADSGIQLTADFGDTFMILGTGNSTLTVGLNNITATSPQDYGYTSFDIGLKNGIWYMGLGIVNYDAPMSDYNRGQFEFGFAF